MAVDIRLENLLKDFGTVIAVNNLTLTFPSGSVTCLLGPSGCGKTTLMRMIAGLEEPTSGDIFFGDERVTELSPSQRNIGMVFQYPVVYRGMTVFENVELPLMEEKSLSKAQRKTRVEETIESLDLQHAARRDVSRLDNGTRQKVAVARAVARQPRIILFDEPITNVDVSAKVQLKQALKKLVKQHNQTIIYVTHDQTEAMTLADEIALMRDGEIVQRGTPRELYNDPQDRFGGWFLGNPGMNFVDYNVSRESSGISLTGPLFKNPVTVSGLNGHDELVVGIRPERIRVYHQDAPSNGAVEAVVVARSVVVGGQHLITLRVGDQLLKAKTRPEDQYEADEKVWVEFPLEHLALFDTGGHRLSVDLNA